MKQRQFISYVFLLLAQSMVGLSIVFSKGLLLTMSPLTIMTMRFGFAAIALFVLHLIVGKPCPRLFRDMTAREFALMFVQAVSAGTLFNLFMLMGLHYTSASVAGIITSALPAIIAFLSLIFLRERLSLLTGLCIATAVLGLVVINVPNLSASSGNSLLGDALILLALLPEAFYYILAKFQSKRIPVFLFAAMMAGLNVPVFIGMGLISHQAVLASLTLSQFEIVSLLAFSSAAFYVFYSVGSTHVQGTEAALTTAFMPIATLLIAFVYLHETISLVQMLGMLLVMLSIFINAKR